MLGSGDVVDVDLGMPEGREAGFHHPVVVVVVTAQRILENDPSVIHVVPITRTIRGFGSEVVIEAGSGNGLVADFAAQCQLIRSVSSSRASQKVGNVGPTILRQIREVVALILDMSTRVRVAPMSCLQRSLADGLDHWRGAMLEKQAGHARFVGATLGSPAVPAPAGSVHLQRDRRIGHRGPRRIAGALVV